jgi:hypothetical protein
LIPRLPSGRTDYARFRELTGDNMIPGDGDIPNALTHVDDVGRYVARIIADPRTLNKMVFAHNEVLTANKAYDMMESLSGEKIQRNYVSPTTFRPHSLLSLFIFIYSPMIDYRRRLESSYSRVTPAY